MSSPVVISDGDPSWQLFAGTVRLRFSPLANALQLQVSTLNPDGTTYSVATFNMPGALRDVRQSATAWPAYAAAGFRPGQIASPTEREAAEILGTHARHHVTTDPNTLPISPNTQKVNFGG